MRILAFIAIALMSACAALGWREVNVRIVGATDGGAQDGAR